VVILILLAAVGTVGLVLYQKAREFTSAEPVQVPVYQAQPDEVRQIQSRVDLFKKAVDSNSGAVLELSANDINALIADSAELNGKIFIRIADGLFYVDGSIPMTQMPGFKDRYLNGTVGFEVSVENGKPKLMPKNVLLNGKQLPSDIQQSAGEGFANGFLEEVESNPDSKQFFSRVKSLQIEGDRVRIEITPLETGAPAQAPNADPIANPQTQAPPPPAPPAPPAGKTHYCHKQVMAYDRNSPAQPLGYFLQGSTLEIIGPSQVPGMIEVRFQEAGAAPVDALCKAEDLGMGPPGADAQPSDGLQPEFKGLGGSQQKQNNPHYKGFNQQ